MADEVVEMLREAAREALPPMEGELQVGGLSGPVEIRRDCWGSRTSAPPTSTTSSSPRASSPPPTDTSRSSC